MAFAVIVLAGLKAAAPVILPVLAAALLSVACLPVTRRLTRYGMPRWLAILLVMGGVTVLLLLISGIVAGSLRSLTAQLGSYQQQFGGLWAESQAWLASHGLPVSSGWLQSDDSTARWIQVLRDTAEGLLSFFSQTFLVLLVMIFMLFEAHAFESKVRAAYGDAERLEEITSQVYRYLGIKAAMSLLTGILVGVLDVALGVKFAVLWALIAFLFNFIPTIGSIVAAVPPIGLALLEFGLPRALAVGVGYLIVNLGIANGLEPRIMGERLGLSPLVVILSLLFWAWMWGPMGMILALPVTMVVKIFLESRDDLRPIAMLLGGEPRYEGAEPAD